MKRLLASLAAQAYALVVVVGCSGSSTGATAGSNGGSSGAGAGTGGSSGASGSSAGGNGGAVGGSAGSGGSAAGSAGSAGSSGEQPLVPLVTGHVWTFEFTPIDSGQPMTDSCATPTVEVGMLETIGDMTGMHYQSFCSEAAMLITGSGDSLVAHQILQAPTLGQAVEFIHSPVAEGESWISGTTMMTWASVPGMVEVPAGTFSNCWQRVAALGSGVVSLTYCRGTGLVSGIHLSGNWTMALVSKNF